MSDSSRGNSLSTGVAVGIGTGCGLLVMSLVGVGIYAIRQKKRAEKAIGLSKPFGNQFITPLIFFLANDSLRCWLNAALKNLWIIPKTSCVSSFLGSKWQI